MTRVQMCGQVRAESRSCRTPVLAVSRIDWSAGLQFGPPTWAHAVT
jgi:hypothetical protein